MMRKRAENLQPLKINRESANYQCLLLDMMSKLVTEQRESNRLLKKIAGEDAVDANDLSKLSVFTSPKKRLAESIIGNYDLSPSGSPDKEGLKMNGEDRSSFDDYRFSKVAVLSPSKSAHVDSLLKAEEERDQLAKKVEGFGDILNRIEVHLTKKEETEEKGEKKKIVKITENGIQTEPAAPMESSIGFKEFVAPNVSRNNLNKEAFGLFPKKSASKKKIDIQNFTKFNNNPSERSIVRNSKNFAPSDFDSILGKGNEPTEVASSKLEKDIEQKKNYSILSEILPYSDRREIKVKISIEDILAQYKSKEESVEPMKVTEEWLGLVYRATASICWNMLSNHLLSFDETKILFTENIIYNFIEFMKTFKDISHQESRVRLVENLNATSVNILDFLCTQYPQTKVEDPNIALRAEIPQIDNKGRVKYDFIGGICKNKVVSFRKKVNGDYTPEIMKVINHMIDKTNEDFAAFDSIMGGLFGEIFLPIQKRKLPEGERGEETHEDHIYFERVKSYTKFLIGRKISKNTCKYSDPEIENGEFFVKSPAVLRIITKWMEELDEMVGNSENAIKNANQEFKDHDGMPIHLYAQVKNALHKAIKEHKGVFNQRVNNIKQECFNLEVLLTLEKYTTDPTQIHLSEEQISVGKYCTYVKSAIASYICSELNELIDFLLEIPQAIDETAINISDPYFQEQAKKDLDSVNLINFKIFDLLRCKCHSNESEIIYLLRRINDKSNDPNDPLKIVRIKDRLNSGTRDILINAQVGKGLVCEIQLGVTSTLEKKQELLDQYNHFLYELKRAKLGAITESASIWSALEQRARFFEEEIMKDVIKPVGQKAHPCISDFTKSESRRMVKFSRPIICASCGNFFEIPNTCLSNIKCEGCNDTYCG
jgi:hypothetical protein